MLLLLYLIIDFCLLFKNGKLERLFKFFGRELLFSVHSNLKFMPKSITFQFQSCPFNSCLYQLLFLLLLIRYHLLHLLLKLIKLFVDYLIVIFKIHWTSSAIFLSWTFILLVQNIDKFLRFLIVWNSIGLLVERLIKLIVIIFGACFN